MGWAEAALWGLAGGLATGTLSLMAAVKAAGYRWPWKEGQMWPRLFVLAGSLLLGALVATAAHNQISGPWPAFIMGAGAPATIRGLLSGVEVTPRQRTPPPRPSGPARQPALATQEEGDISENAT